MATLTMPRAHGANVMAGVGDGQSLKAAACTYTLAAALAGDDVLVGPTIQKGATVLDVILHTTDLDTGTPAIMLDVGIPGDADKFIDGSNVGQAGGTARGVFAPYTMEADQPVQVTVATGPDAGATTGTVSLTVIFLPVAS